MSKGRWLLLGFGLVGCLAIGVVAYAVWPTRQISRENCERIRIGMPEKMVVEILGPPRDDCTSEVAIELPRRIGERHRTYIVHELGQREHLHEQLQEVVMRRGWPTVSPRQVKVWASNEIVICIRFDEGNRVLECDSLNAEPLKYSTWRRLRRWLRL
jgi:hypothetical protein